MSDRHLELIAFEEDPVFRPNQLFGDEFSVAPDFEQQVVLFGFKDGLRFALPHKVVS